MIRHESMVFNLSMGALSRMGAGFNLDGSLDWKSWIDSINVVGDRAIVLVKITNTGHYPYMNNSLTLYARELEVEIEDKN